MSHSPFDGVLLDDQRPTVPGALAMLLHAQIAEKLGRRLNKDGIRARAEACGELIAHGLFPDSLRGLQKHGLDLGRQDDLHSLSSLAEHLEQYMEAISAAGYIDPNAALWKAVDAELEGRRGLWCERTPQDGPIAATMQDLQPVRLRALACLPSLGGASFKLATRRGGSASGLFGSSQPLVDWFLDGLESHGLAFAADIQLDEPEGWGCAPWSACLDSLFECELDLKQHGDCFQRALAESPFDLIRLAVEQVAAWTSQGIAAKDIAIIHPAPEKIVDFLKVLLGAESIQLNASGAFRPLVQSEAWSPIWSLLQGLLNFDPLTAAAGLNASRRPEIRAWAEALSAQDQTGQRSFEAAIDCLPQSYAKIIVRDWQSFLRARAEKISPPEWCEAISGLAAALHFPADSEEYYAPLGLLRECWSKIAAQGKGMPWTYERALGSLHLFLESARAAGSPPTPDGVRLIKPAQLMDDWRGADAVLILDLSDGAWPGKPTPNPDLDWSARAAINSALLMASKNHEGPFPPALQRFWLPRAEHASQAPRTFQRDAYAFNKALAMTRKCLVALSPSQDESGRKMAQGPFWQALEGAAEWAPGPKACQSHLRWAWEGCLRHELADSRAQALGAAAIFAASSPLEDRIPSLQASLLKTNAIYSPTLLESLATCPFRAMAERVWNLDAAGDAGSVRMSEGTILHGVLERIYRPLVDAPDLAAAFAKHYGMSDSDSGNLKNLVEAAWEETKNEWLSKEKRLSNDQKQQALEGAKALLPNLETCIDNDLSEESPSLAELDFLYPGTVKLSKRSESKQDMEIGWRRTLLGTEQKLGPIEMPLPDGETMTVAGVVDRIELWENEIKNLSFIRITDYKASSSDSLREYAKGDAPFAGHLQTPLYAWMAVEIYGCLATSVLIPLREGKPKPFSRHLSSLAECDNNGIGWKKKLGETLARLATRIREGDCPPAPGAHCQYCGYAALCLRPVDIAPLDAEAAEAVGA